MFLYFTELLNLEIEREKLTLQKAFNDNFYKSLVEVNQAIIAWSF